LGEGFKKVEKLLKTVLSKELHIMLCRSIFKEPGKHTILPGVPNGRLTAINGL
jgi:hypothetical protein